VACEIQDDAFHGFFLQNVLVSSAHSRCRVDECMFVCHALIGSTRLAAIAQSRITSRCKGKKWEVARCANASRYKRKAVAGGWAKRLAQVEQAM
jgi:hypothetical protein